MDRVQLGYLSVFFLMCWRFKFKEPRLKFTEHCSNMKLFWSQYQYASKFGQKKSAIYCVAEGNHQILSYSHPLKSSKV